MGPHHKFEWACWLESGRKMLKPVIFTNGASDGSYALSLSHQILMSLSTDAELHRSDSILGNVVPDKGVTKRLMRNAFRKC